jgi:hypothetical protein
MPPDAPEPPEAWEDPIVAEVHQIRQQIMAEFENDLDAYFRYGQAVQEEKQKRGVRYVTAPLRKSDLSTPAI